MNFRTFTYNLCCTLLCFYLVEVTLESKAFGQSQTSLRAMRYLNLGVEKAISGDYAEAIYYFNEAIEISPQYDDAYYNRGVIRSRLGDYVGAIADFDEAIEINSQYAVAYHRRGIAKTGLNDHTGAIVDFSEAIKIDPQYEAALHNREFVRSILGIVEL